MNKAELVQAMADDAGLSKSDAEKALNACLTQRLALNSLPLRILVF